MSEQANSLARSKGRGWPGRLAFWDNRATQHYAAPDYRERRVMQRVSILLPSV